MLRHLANCVQFPGRGDREIVFVATAYPTTGVPLHELFMWSKLPFANSEELPRLEREFLAPFDDWPKNISDYRVEWIAPDNYVLLGVDSDSRSCVQLDHWNSAPDDLCIVTTGSWMAKSEHSLSLQEALLLLVPKLAVQEEVRESISRVRNELPDRFLGVHFRNSDLKSDYEKTVAQMQHLATRHDLRVVYWATDDRESLDRVVIDFPQFSFVSMARIPSNLGSEVRALHFAPESLLSQYGLTKRRQQVDALADVYALSSANAFIGNPASGLSILVTFLRETPALCNSFFFGESATGSPSAVAHG